MKKKLFVGLILLGILASPVGLAIGFSIWGAYTNPQPRCGGVFCYDLSDGVYFERHGWKDKESVYIKQYDSYARPDELNENGVAIVSHTVTSNARVRIVRGEGLPPTSSRHDIVPANITECHVSQNAIFGKVNVPKNPSATDANCYDGWFFFDIPGKISYHLLTEAEYNEILDKYEIASADRALSPTSAQDQNKWPKFPKTF